MYVPTIKNQYKNLAKQFRNDSSAQILVNALQKLVIWSLPNDLGLH